MKLQKYHFILLILCFVFGNSSFGQLVIDAGKDTTYCTSIEKIYLGKNITIRKAIGSYSIRWECKVPKGSHSYFTASDLLSDTTAISPFFTYFPSNNQWIKFILHVKDSENNYAKDSVRVRFSKFSYLTGYFVYELTKGDSILFKYPSVGGGIEPLDFHWQPKAGLSNPDNLETWCKPDFPTQYSIIAVDSCGCISSPNLAYEIRILPTGFDMLDIDRDNLLKIRQNGRLIYFNNPLNQEAHISLYSINGNARHNLTTTEDHFKMDCLLKSKGIYIVKISLGKHTGSSKFINP